MKLSLKAVNGKLRFLAQRVGQGLKHVLDCCCETQPPPPSDRYVIFGDCCGLPSPLIAVKVSLVVEFANECSNNIGFVVVRVIGQERCYSAFWPPTSPTLSLETVRSMNIQPFDTRNQIQCVETKTTNPPFQCRTESCPECPRDCCIAIVYGTRQCPDIQDRSWFNPASDPSDLFCCSYGRQCTSTWRHNYRLEEKTYTYCATDSGDCFGNRLLDESLTQYSDEEVRRFTRCLENGTSPEFGSECISHNHYARQYARSLDPCTGSVTGVSDRQFQRWNTCVDGPSVGPLPPEEFFPARPRRTFDIGPFCNGEDPIETFDEVGNFNRNDPPVCQDVDNNVTIKRRGSDRDCSTYSQETTTTTIRYDVNCLRGSYYFDQFTEVRGYGMTCPPDGSLLYTRRITRSASYFITIDATEYCDPTLCDQYRRRPNAMMPFTRQDVFNSQPIQGALNLL